MTSRLQRGWFLSSSDNTMFTPFRRVLAESSSLPFPDDAASSIRAIRSRGVLPRHVFLLKRSRWGMVVVLASLLASLLVCNGFADDGSPGWWQRGPKHWPTGWTARSSNLVTRIADWKTALKRPEFLPDSVVERSSFSENERSQSAGLIQPATHDSLISRLFSRATPAGYHVRAVGDPELDCDASCGFTLKDDGLALPGMLWDDTKAAANWNNGLILGTVLGGAILMRQDLDEQVREATADHPRRWGEFSRALGYMGNAEYQAAALGTSYALSLWRQDEQWHELNKSLISAYTLTAASTVLIKVIANTDRPSEDWYGGRYGFPSHHTSSSFALAAVLDEYYGPKVGLPAYAFAGMIGWSRIDNRDHDLSDVFFGAALGYVIGKSVACHHRYGDGRVRLLPYVHPTDGSTGIMCEVPF